METKDVLLELRTKNGLSQDEVAERVYVTRQAVSRWGNGDTVPNTETLKLLSRLFNVSINTLLGTQLQSEFDQDRCFGVLANMDFILISTYGADGADPELILYRKR